MTAEMPPVRRFLWSIVIGVSTIIGVVLGIFIAILLVFYYLIIAPIWAHTFSNLSFRILARWNSHPYPPLPLGSAGQIRLLRIHPGIKGAAMECDLVAANLNSAEYEALSYCWGNKYLVHPITVNGDSFLVTSNLFRALKALRDSAATRTFWIDAICINQSNIAERGQQVGMMRGIYENAQRVVVWLGPSPRNIEISINTIIKAATAPSSEVHAILEGKLDWQVPLLELLRLDWWKRMWVLQEVVAARSVTALCGEYVLPWDDLCWLIRHPTSSNRFSEGNFTTYMFIEYLLHMKESRAAPRYGLLSLAHQFRYREASHDLDKLYALIGLLPSTEDALVTPDYTKSHTEVYREFAKACIRRYSNLLVVAMGDTHRMDSSTWCPTWHISTVYDKNSLFWEAGLKTRVPFPIPKTYSAAGNHPCLCNIDYPDTGIISAKGFSYDTITAVGQGSGIGSYSLEDTIDRWHTLAMKSKTSTAAEAEAAFNRTLTADRWTEQPIDFSYWLSKASKLNQTSLQNMYQSTIEAACSYRRFFVTENGTFGLGAEDLKAGDIVVVFLGSDVPLIIRASDHSNKAREWLCLRKDHSYTYHKVICQAYVDGIMEYRGDMAEDIELGRVVLEEYYLE